VLDVVDNRLPGRLRGEKRAEPEEYSAMATVATATSALADRVSR
jgi:hypothetical protein